MSVLITVFSVVLCFISVIMIFLVLMQKAKSDAGVAAMGGGMAESTFGAETGNVLSKGTINAAIAFFVLSFILYLANVYQTKHHAAVDNKLPTVVAPAITVKPSVQPVTQPATQAAVQPPAVQPSASKKP
jgi:preprotein translocase subunit SecG